ncbi:MAG: SCP2 sterol-binding domain-containing protein [Candidatus Thermoplasmatota archaeon]|nr:SCP2 sterol-binding domain-containing protein [Candidatus Thermoplasmatota archaeon]MCL5731051.1 SCP2 sterol-binding domain-containing protein [Candidatus Thermoplasmatota archaeon]
MKDMLEDLRKRVNDRAATDEKFAKKLAGFNKTFLVAFDDRDFYNFRIEDGKVGEIAEGNAPSDIEISVPSEVFKKIISREIDPMSAYLEKKIKIKASLFDKLFLTELFK